MRSKRTTALSLVLFTLILLGAGCARGTEKRVPEAQTRSDIYEEGALLQESEERLEVESEAAAVPEGWERYTSASGLKFSYPKTFDRGQGVEQVELGASGNSVSIFPSTQSGFKHTIMVLSKPPAESIQNWIERELLIDANQESNCGVQSAGTRTSDNAQAFELYEITSDRGILAECGNYYLGGAEGGLWYSGQVPDKVLFIAIGQDSFLGGDLQKFLNSIEVTP